MKTIINKDIEWYQTLKEKWFEVISVNNENYSKYIKTLINAYKQVFSASAWQEWKKCVWWCDAKRSFEDAPQNCCSVETVDFYSDKVVENYVKNVICKTYNQCLVILNLDSEVSWFTWWWKDDLASINSQKLRLNEDNIQKLFENLDKIGINPIKEDFYYQSETWVMPEYRKSWIWKNLVRVNEEIIKSNRDKISSIIQRTSERSPMFNIRRDLGYEVVYKYDDEDNRVLFAKNNI